MTVGVVEPMDLLVPRARPEGWGWLAWIRFRRRVRRELRRWARRELRQLQRDAAGHSSRGDRPLHKQDLATHLGSEREEPT